VIALVRLILLLGLPSGMSMGMGGCRPFDATTCGATVGMCLFTVGVIEGLVLLLFGTLGDGLRPSRGVLLARSLERPPRLTA